MKFKQLSIFTLIVAMMIVTAAVVSAQDGTGRPPRNSLGFGPDIAIGAGVITDATGLDLVSLREALQNGSTTAELIVANGGDVDAVTAELVALVTEHINEHLANGDITQEQADTMLSNAETRISERLNGTFERPDFGMKRPDMEYSTIILDATGLDFAGIRDALQSGSTLAQLIEANGNDVDTVIADLVAEATTQINEHLANGDITQEQADTMLSNIETRITERLNGTFERPAFGNRGGRGGRGGHGGFGNPPAAPDGSGA